LDVRSSIELAWPTPGIYSTVIVPYNWDLAHKTFSKGKVPNGIKEKHPFFPTHNY
jgi:hypothetical protein